MQNAQVKFPRRLFIRIVLFHLLSIGVVLLLYRSQSEYAPYLMALLAMISALWIGYDTVKPLQRVLNQTLNQPQGPAFHDDLSQEAFGEWSELESNLEGMKKNLEATAHNLTMEQIELDTLLGAISDAVLAVDLEEVPLFYNSRLEIILGDKKFNRQSKLWEIFRNTEVITSFKRALEKGKVWTTNALLFQLSSQSKRYFVLSVSPLRRHDGTIYGALGIFHDVTELKTAEQMRIDFVANVSHELRTPLTSIKGFTETLISDANRDPSALASSESRVHLETIQRNSARLMNLLSDLLDLSSIESTEMLHKEWLTTSEMTEKAYRQIQEKIQHKKQTFQAEYLADKVFADPMRLEQVLVNLMDNASKYTPEGGGITVSWKEKGNDVVFKLSDTGPGIPIDAQPRIFERFYRVDKSRSRDQGGTGLGLAIVKHIMQRHEGAVWLESAAGKGSTFLCRFPLPSRPTSLD